MPVLHHSGHRVVITGVGMITPLGNDTATTWQRACAGISGLGPVPLLLSLDDYHVASVGCVVGEQSLLDAALSPKFQSKTDRFMHLALIAGHEALCDAHFSETFPVNRNECGVYLGVGIGGLQKIEHAVHEVQRAGLKRLSPFTIPQTISNMAPAWLAQQWNLQGPVMACVNACASGTDAFGLAFRLVRDGYQRCMLAGGTESCITPLALAGFGNMRALATWTGDPAAASRPFDRGRTGFVLAEGASVVVMETLESAQQRGACIYAEIVGYGAAADAYHGTAMHPEGRGAIQAMVNALDDAGITPADVHYVNAHGTGTAMNDAIETQALKKVFGNYVDPGRQSHIT